MLKIIRFPLIIFILFTFAWEFKNDINYVFINCVEASSKDQPISTGSYSHNLKFADIAAESGIHFRHDSGKRGEFLYPETNSGGGGIWDPDGDGDPDILLLSGTAVEADGSPASSVHLYENDGSGHFRNITGAAGLILKGDVQTFAVADADHDGDLDLAVGGYDVLRLYINNGNNKFTDATAERGLSNFKGFVNALAWIDTNRTGWPDLAVGRYGIWSPEINRKLDCRRADGKRTYCGPRNLEPDRMAFYHNESGNFSDWTKNVGMWDLPTKALGILTLDHDNDGWSDLFVANDAQPNLLFLNQHDGTYSEEGLLLGIATLMGSQAYAGMGVDVVDFDGNGRLCIAVGNFEGEPVTLHCQSEEDDGSWTSDYYEEHSFDTYLAHSTSPPVTFGLKFADLDLDGTHELLVANGHVFDHKELTGVPQPQPLQVLVTTKRTAKGIPVFQDITPQGGFAGVTGIGRGLATADIDGDGDIDILYIDKDGPTRLLRNDSPLRGDPIRFRLVGGKGSPEGLGAKISFNAGDRSYRATIVSGGSYAGESERKLSFGLPHDIRPKEVEVRWSSGIVENFHLPDKGIHITLIQGNGKTLASAAKKKQVEAIISDKDPNELQNIVKNLFVNEVPSQARIEEVKKLLQDGLNQRRGHPQLALSLARLLAITGKLKEARTLLEQALEYRPDLVEVRRELSMLLWINGEKEKAHSHVSHLLDRGNNQAFRLTRLAVPFLNASMPDLALQVIDTVINDDPNQAEAHALRVGTLLNLGNVDAAENEGINALKTRPGHAPTLVSMGYVALQQNKGAQAGDYFRRALKQRRTGDESPEALAGLATVLTKMGKVKEAAELLLEAVDLRPSPMMAFNAAQLLLGQNDIKGAINALEKTLEIEPNHLQAMLSLASLELSTEHYEKALALCRKTLRIAPGHPQALEMIKSIESTGFFVPGVNKSNRSNQLKDIP